MSSEVTLGWIGGIAGAVIGLIGGVVGTFFGIKNTRGPRERYFMINSAAIAWIAILAFVGLLFTVPRPYHWLLWIPYTVLLPLGIIYGNRRQQAIRHDESKQNSSSV